MKIPKYAITILLAINFELHSSQDIKKQIEQTNSENLLSSVTNILNIQKIIADYSLAYDLVTTLDVPKCRGIYQVLYLNEGKHLALTSDDKIKIMDTDTNSKLYGQCIYTLRGHDNPIYSLKNSNNGHFLASKSSDGIINIWDLNVNSATYCKCIKTFQSIGRIGQHETSMTITFSPCNKYLAYVDSFNTISLYEINYDAKKASNDHIKKFAHDNCMIWSIVFSVCGKYLISGNDNNIIKIWDNSNEYGKCIKTLDGNSRPNNALDSNPFRLLACSFDKNDSKTKQSNTKYLASVSYENIKIWDIDPISEAFGSIIKSFIGHKGTIQTIGFSQCGKYLISSDTSTIKIWDIDSIIKEDGSCIYTYELTDDNFRPMTYSSDSKYIALGMWGKIKILKNRSFALLSSSKNEDFSIELLADQESAITESNTMRNTICSIQ